MSEKQYILNFECLLIVLSAMAGNLSLTSIYKIKYFALIKKVIPTPLAVLTHNFFLCKFRNSSLCIIK